MLQNELHQVMPGRWLAPVHVPSSTGFARTLHKGIVPDGSPLASPESRSFVVCNEGANSGELAIALGGIDDEPTTVGIEPRTDAIAQDPEVLRKALWLAMKVAGVTLVEVDPQAVTVSPAVLRHIGFHATEFGTMHFAA